MSTRQSEKKYTDAVDTKFNPDGYVRYFPGNTIICHLNQKSTVFKEALWAQNQIKETTFHRKFALLPPESFHMTVFELLCDQVRKSEYWSRFLPPFAAIEETDQFFKTKFAQMEFPKNFELCYDKIQLEHNFSIRLLPANQNIEKELRVFRESLSETTGIRFPDHERYRFHISLGYRLEEMSAEEKIMAKKTALKIDKRLGKRFGKYHTGSPQLVFFHDMFEFLPSIKR